MSSPLREACAFCRVGSCAVHGVFRIVPHTHPAIDDDAMVEVGCCDQLEEALRAGFIKRRLSDGRLYLQSTRYLVLYCPFCCTFIGKPTVKR